MHVTAIATESAPRPRGNYSQGVQVRDLLFVSGQLPLDAEGHPVGGTIAEQTRQALRNVQAVVEAAGASLAQIVQCTIYITDIEEWVEVDRVYGSFLAGVPFLPARAVVPVKELHYGARIEIQAIAALHLD
jgi:2-iminobutanoate/2-iminopropanoate deaminase